MQRGLEKLTARFLLLTLLLSLPLPGQAQERLTLVSRLAFDFGTDWSGGFSGAEVSGDGRTLVLLSDRGSLVFGGHMDRYPSYKQRGNLPVVHDVLESAAGLFPMLSRLRLVRHWGGVMDMTPDGSPIISRSPVDGLFLNCGWNYGGFKATPGSGWMFAHTLAHGEPHEINAAFALDRFEQGNIISESGYEPLYGIQ